MKGWKLIPLQKRGFRRCGWIYRDVILFSIIDKIAVRRENRGELLDDEIKKRASQTAYFKNILNVYRLMYFTTASVYHIDMLSIKQVNAYHDSTQIIPPLSWSNRLLSDSQPTLAKWIRWIEHGSKTRAQAARWDTHGRAWLICQIPNPTRIKKQGSLKREIVTIIWLQF